MIYCHGSFTLDTNLHTVRDLHGRELYVKGQAYDLLAFLCERKSANVSEVGAALGQRRLTQGYLRHLRHKLRLAIGHEVVAHHGNACWMAGEVRPRRTASVSVVASASRPATASNKLQKVRVAVKWAKRFPRIVRDAMGVLSALFAGALLLFSLWRALVVDVQIVATTKLPQAVTAQGK